MFVIKTSNTFFNINIPKLQFTGVSLYSNHIFILALISFEQLLIISIIISFIIIKEMSAFCNKQ